MNNTGLYQFAYNGGWVHTALMGDPTLRMHILAPVENLSAQQDNQHIRLEWDDPANALGYFVYKKRQETVFSSNLIRFHSPILFTWIPAQVPV